MAAFGNSALMNIKVSALALVNSAAASRVRAYRTHSISSRPSPGWGRRYDLFRYRCQRLYRQRLVSALLSHSGSTVYFLLRDPSVERVEKLRAYWGGGSETATIPVAGDLTKAGLGVAANDLAALKNRVDHVFHLGAVYALDADPAT